MQINVNLIFDPYTNPDKPRQYHYDDDGDVGLYANGSGGAEYRCKNCKQTWPESEPSYYFTVWVNQDI